MKWFTRDRPDPLGPALSAIGDTGTVVEPDDEQLLRRGQFVYDALCAYCQQRVGQARS